MTNPEVMHNQRDPESDSVELLRGLSMQIEDQSKLKPMPCDRHRPRLQPIRRSLSCRALWFLAQSTQRRAGVLRLELDYWVVTRYEDINAIFSDIKTISVSIAQSPIKPLARLGLRIILEELTQRLSTLRLVPDQLWAFPPNTWFRGSARLLVE